MKFSACFGCLQKKILLSAMGRCASPPDELPAQREPLALQEKRRLISGKAGQSTVPWQLFVQS